MHYCQISYVMIYSRNEHIYRMSSQCVVARIENVYLQIHIFSGLIDCINLKYYKPQHVSISISIKYIRLQFSEYEMEFTYNITGNNNTMLNLANYWSIKTQIIMHNHMFEIDEWHLYLHLPIRVKNKLWWTHNNQIHWNLMSKNVRLGKYFEFAVLF